uniref:Ig-like domain-containing protein n=1 Tax=Sphaeramia orbicularis TaxID=375764 RepID=A0A672ZI21_9TELE
PGAALPPTFTKKLTTLEAEEGASVTLCCELSKPGASVEWKKGTQVLKSGEKYQIKQKESVNELLINKVVPDDSGEYSCFIIYTWDYNLQITVDQQIHIKITVLLFHFRLFAFFCEKIVCKCKNFDVILLIFTLKQREAVGAVVIYRILW